jgi:tRNA pseudouridine38-40 synthase
MTRRIKMTVQYDGSLFQGWQVQPGRPTVQGTVESAMEMVFGQAVRVHVAGRTDTGVHARAMPLHFDIDHGIPVGKMPAALSGFLPPTVAILSAEEVGATFDARRNAILRWYRYQVRQTAMRVPLGPRAWHFQRMLDIEKIMAGLDLMQGEHDFKGFRSSQCTSSRTVLNLREASICIQGDLIAFDFKCRSFLQHMIRFLTGSLVSFGHDQVDLHQLRMILEDGTRPGIIQCAPPEGLCLMSVAYDTDDENRIMNASPQPPSF